MNNYHNSGRSNNNNVTNINSNNNNHDEVIRRLHSGVLKPPRVELSGMGLSCVELS